MTKKHAPQPKKGLSWGLISVFVLLLIGVGLYALNRQKENRDEPASISTPKIKESHATPEQPSTDHEEHAKSQASRIPPYFEDPNAAGVLLPTKDPAVVTPYSKAGYVVAQKDPALLAQLPCFCYCDRFGHKSLQTCFVTEHAESCDICLKEAIEADQMKGQGMTPEEIRSVIIAKYRSRQQGS